VYWIYLIIFVIAVLVPDIIRKKFYFLPETRAEELLIFLLGVIVFLSSAWQERLIFLHKREKNQDRKKINQTIKDLVESYSYIGEVNRKMDILMNISLGLTEKSNLSKNKQTEIYHTIIDAAKFLMKADCALLKFINTEDNSLEKEIKIGNCSCSIKNEVLIKMKEAGSAEKIDNFLVTSSHQKIKNVRCYLIVNDYEEQGDKTIEMLTVLASQALFVFSYAGHISD
jgi:hypothetical protein